MGEGLYTDRSFLLWTWSFTLFIAGRAIHASPLRVNQSLQSEGAEKLYASTSQTRRGCEGEGDRREGKLAVTAYAVGAVEGLLFLRFQLCTPSVIGAEDICKRSPSCTDATSPSHLLRR